MITKVMFRKWQDGGDIDAIFPEISNDDMGYGVMTYSHIGQHSGGDPTYYYGRTVPAKPEEYADLLAELKSIGYDDLRVVKRMARGDFETRRKEAERE